MKWESRCYTPPPFLCSFVYGPAFTYLCFFSHQCNALESNFKENWGIQDSLIHQKASNLVNSLLLTYATSVNLWDNMASLQWWFHQQWYDWSEISEWLTCRNWKMIFLSYFWFFKGFRICLILWKQVQTWFLNIQCTFRELSVFLLQLCSDEVPTWYPTGGSRKARKVPSGHIFLTGLQLFSYSLQHCHHGFLWLFPSTCVCIGHLQQKRNQH